MNIRYFASLIVLALVGTGFALWSIEAKNTSSGEAAPAASPETGSLSEARENNQHQEAMAVARSEYTKLSQEVSSARAIIGELARTQTEWKAEIEPLLDNESGQKVAGHEDQVSAFRAHWESVELVPDSMIDNLTQELDILSAPIQAVLGSDIVVGMPDPELSEKLHDLYARAQQHLEPIKIALPALRLIAEKSSQAGSVGSHTLREAIDGMKLAEAKSRASTIDAARRASEEQATQQLALHEQQLAAAEGERKRAEVAAETARVEAQANEIELQRRANDPEMLKRLAPFVGKGKSIFQCVNSRNYGWANLGWLESEGKILSSRPMSLKALTCYGALEPTETGRSRLCELAVSRENDRPHWSADVADPNSEWVEGNQSFLRELGDTLVKERLLLP